MNIHEVEASILRATHLLLEERNLLIDDEHIDAASAVTHNRNCLDLWLSLGLLTLLLVKLLTTMGSLSLLVLCSVGHFGRHTK